MTASHKFTRWYWTTMLTPTSPPMAMTGWWSRCTCCPPARAMYHFDALATEQGRRWFERLVPVPVRFGASPLRASLWSRVRRMFERAPAAPPRRAPKPKKKPAAGRSPAARRKRSKP